MEITLPSSSATSASVIPPPPPNPSPSGGTRSTLIHSLTPSLTSSDPAKAPSNPAHSTPITSMQIPRISTPSSNYCAQAVSSENSLLTIAAPRCIMKSHHAFTPAGPLTPLNSATAILKPPQKFAGLRKLKTLKLEECVVKEGDLERFLLGCRELERLSLEHCYRVWEIRVCQHKLVELEIGVHRGIGVLIDKVPCLESVTLRFQYESAWLYNKWLDKDLKDVLDSDFYDEMRIYDDDDGGGDDGDGGESEVSRVVRFLEGLGNVRNLSILFQKRYLNVNICSL